MTVHFNVVTGKLRHFWELVGESGNYHITKQGRIVPKSFLYPQVYDDFRTASLDLNFAKKRTLKDQASGNNLITFSRVSSGTYVDSDGLIKTTPVNLLTYSEQLDQWTIGGGSSVTANQAVAPNGTNTADRVQHGAGGSSWVRQQILTSGNTYTISVYAKAVTPGTNNQFSFNVGAGTNTDPFIATSEWQRFSATLTATGSLFYINNGDDSYSTDVYFWGAQVQTDSTVTDYIPTGATISGAPRFDHDPATGKSLGLLIEESRTNLTKDSGNLKTTNWRIGEGSVSNTSAPDGSSSDGTIFTENTASNYHGIIAETPNRPSVSGALTLSMFLKAGTRRYVLVSFGAGANGVSVTLDTQSMTISEATAYGSGYSYTNNSATVTPASDDWYRVSFSGTSTAQNTQVVLVRGTNLATGNTFGESYQGNNSTFIVWGAQLEAGTFPTSYIPTTSSTVTRSPDIATIEGTNFSSFYNQSEGTVFVKSSYFGLSSASTGRIYDINNGTTLNRHHLIIRGANNDLRVQTRKNSVDGFSESFSIPAANNLFSNALGYKLNDCASSLNGGNTVNDNTVLIPTVDRMFIGARNLSSAYLNGHISRLAYFPTRKTDQELIDLTKP